MWWCCVFLDVGTVFFKNFAMKRKLAARDDEDLSHVFVVTDEIVHPSKLSDNMCLFSCMFNALKTSELRVAFCAGNMDDPTMAFLEVAKIGKNKAGRSYENERAMCGFNAYDVNHYLSYLEKAGNIKTWTFTKQKMKIFQWSRLLIRNDHQLVGCIFVFCGHTIPSDEKKLMNTRMKKWREQLENAPDASVKIRRSSPFYVEHQLIRRYNMDMPKYLFEKFQNNQFVHGFSIRVEMSGEVWLFDNGLRKPRLVRSIEDIANLLFCVWAVYRFNIECK